MRREGCRHRMIYRGEEVSVSSGELCPGGTLPVGRACKDQCAKVGSLRVLAACYPHATPLALQASAAAPLTGSAHLGRRRSRRRRRWWRHRGMPGTDWHLSSRSNCGARRRNAMQ